MTEDNCFLDKDTFEEGVFNTGFIMDEEDDRDYQFADYLEKKKELIKVSADTEDVACVAGIPLKVDHTSSMSSVKNQGRLGSCVGFATAAMKEWQEKTEHDKEVQAGKKDNRRGKMHDYSEQWLYWNCKKIDGLSSQGTYLRMAMKVLKRIGVPTEKAWPYSDSAVDIGEPKRWANLVALWATIDSYWRVRGLRELKQAIVESPLIIGVSVFDNWYNPQGGLIDIPDPPARSLGGHAICAVGYDDEKKAIKIKNSWGKNWGDEGYAYLTYDFIEHHMWVAWAARDIAVTRDMLKGARVLIG